MADRRLTPRSRLGRVVLCGLLPLAAGCAGNPQAHHRSADGPLEPYPLFSATDALLQDWLHFNVWRETDWALEALDDEVVVSATGRSSSSGLGRYTEIDSGLCPVVEWSWRVEALPEDADLGVRAADDVAASLMLAFGDPGSLSSPRPVPTLRYVWSTAVNPVGSVVDSPSFPGVLKSVVVRSGGEDVGRWVSERRNLRDDYRQAFGELPVQPIHAFALFTDNDSLKQPAIAYYRSASLLCSEPPESSYP